MGLYINPPNMTKEEWIRKHGKQITRDEAREFVAIKAENHLPCVLIDNGWMTALGVGFNKN